MKYYDRLTSERKTFLHSLYSLMHFELFEERDNEDEESERIQSISIDGEWGSGKSHFKEALEEYIKKESPKVDVITYNAWQSDYYDDAMKSMISEIND